MSVRAPTSSTAPRGDRVEAGGVYVGRKEVVVRRRRRRRRRFFLHCQSEHEVEGSDRPCIEGVSQFLYRNSDLARAVELVGRATSNR
eukprot:7700481-Pyramimonas_sp.AAC.1